jgi:hypothetical protein
MGRQKEEWKNEENLWYQQAREAAQALADRPAFSYAPERDPLYQAAKTQALTEGRRAMEDTLGKAAGLTGGYASSYAQSLGTQAYQRQIARLAELLPDYYDKARNNYDKQTEALHDALSTALGLYDKDYQSWLDREEAADKQERWEQEFADSRDRWEQERADKNSHWQQEFTDSRDRWEQDRTDSQDRWQQEQADKNSHWQQEFTDSRDRWEQDYDQEERKMAAQYAANAASSAASAQENARSYAYRMAMLALQQGLSVSDALLQAAGIDKAYAETIRRYFAYHR